MPNLSQLGRLILRHLLLTSLLFLNSTSLQLPQLVGRYSHYNQLSPALSNQAPHEPPNKFTANQQYSNLQTSLSNIQNAEKHDTFAQTWLRPTPSSASSNARLHVQGTAKLALNINANNNYFNQELNHEGSGNGPLSGKHQQPVKFDDTEEGEDDEEDEDDYVDKETSDTGSGLGKELSNSQSNLTHVNPVIQSSTKDLQSTTESIYYPFRLPTVETSANESKRPMTMSTPITTQSSVLSNLLLANNKKSPDQTNNSSSLFNQEESQDKDFPVFTKTITTKWPITLATTLSITTTMSTTTTQSVPTTIMHVATPVPNTNPTTLTQPTLKQPPLDTSIREKPKQIFSSFPTTQRPRYSKNPILPLAGSVPTMSPSNYAANQNYNVGFPATFKPNVTKLSNGDYNEDDEESDDDFEDSIDDPSIFSDGYESSSPGDIGDRFNFTFSPSNPSTSFTTSRPLSETPKVTSTQSSNYFTTPLPSMLNITTSTSTTNNATFNHSTIEISDSKIIESTLPPLVFKPTKPHILMEPNVGADEDYNDKEEEEEEEDNQEEDEDEDEEEDEEEEEEEEDELQFSLDQQELRRQNSSISSSPQLMLVSSPKPETILPSIPQYTINSLTSTPQYTGPISETKQLTSTLPPIIIASPNEVISTVPTATIPPSTLPTTTSSETLNTVDKSIEYQTSTTALSSSTIQDPVLVSTSRSTQIDFIFNQRTKTTPRHSINLSNYNEDLRTKQDPDITQVIFDKAVELYYDANKAIHNAVDVIWPPSVEFSTSSMEQLISNPLLFMRKYQNYTMFHRHIIPSVFAN